MPKNVIVFMKQHTQKGCGIQLWVTVIINWTLFCVVVYFYGMHYFMYGRLFFENFLLLQNFSSREIATFMIVIDSIHRFCHTEARW